MRTIQIACVRYERTDLEAIFPGSRIAHFQSLSSCWYTLLYAHILGRIRQLIARSIFSEYLATYYSIDHCALIA